jgi:hypothetical protein
MLILEEIDCLNDCSTDCPSAILVNAGTCAQDKFWVRSGRINNIPNFHLKHHLIVYKVVYCLESFFPSLLFASQTFIEGKYDMKSAKQKKFSVCCLHVHV